jgi:tripartite-type tricarboxylate transporter receptor subunit TctC
MKLARRRLLRSVAGAAALAVPRFASAQSYPIRPVRIVTGAPAGLAPDIVARLIAQWLSARLRQQFVVENRPGTGTNIAAEAVIRSAPDGYTLFLATPANAINAALYRSLNFNFMRDTAPVAGICSGPYVMVVNSMLPATTVADFIAYAKANAGKINMASAGNGTPPHVFGELFKMMAGVDLVHVPYRSNYMPDLLAGQVQASFSSIAASIELVRAGKLRALAVTPSKRIPMLPDTPAMAEFVSGYDASSWYGICAPQGTSVEIIDVLNQEIRHPGFGKFIAGETEKWERVVKFAGIKAE